MDLTTYSTGIQHIGIPTNDIETTIAFYHKLGFETAFETVHLECRRGNRNSLCSGEMRRYKEEHQWRRRITGRQLTVRRESVGSKQD